MKYIRHDVIGQSEEFEGSPAEIMTLLKLFEMDENEEVIPYVTSDECFIISFPEDAVIVEGSENSDEEDN